MATVVNSSFSTNFWGKDDRGSEVVINKMNQGAQTIEELLIFMKERISIEEDYSRRMNNLSKKFQITGVYETGKMKEVFDTLKIETEQMAKSHANESRKFKFDIYDKLETFLSNFKAKRKPIETSIENILATKKMLVQKVLKLKERYQVETTKLNTFLAQENLLMGKELEKNRDKIFRQKQVVSEYRSEYQNNCAKLEEINKIWISEWQMSSTKLQQLENERIEFMIKELWEYSNLISTSCVNDDSSCEHIRKTLESCEPNKEISYFIQKFQTGTKIYQTPKFVDFVYNGNVDDDQLVMGENIIQSYQTDMRSASASTGISGNSSIHNVGMTVVQSLDPQLQHGHQQQRQQTHPSLKITERTNFSRRPPPSEDGQTSISNHSTNISGPSTNSLLQREQSAYSNPTSISSFTESVDDQLRSSQNWNSPTRRRSRNSECNAPVASKKPPSPRKSFILEPQERQKAKDVPHIDLTNEDPLRATLEDLKIGGNGDMNKFKEYISNSRPSSQFGNNNFNSSTSSQKTNGTTIRPKSMIVEALPPVVQSQNQLKRSSFHAGLRSQSRSSVNLQAKLNNNLPPLTSDGRRVIKHVTALFEFNATIEGELSFKEGDILSVVHMQEDGWWECENIRTRETGLAPYNYVEKI